MKYKHGDKVRNWRYAWGYIPNPKYNPHIAHGAEFKDSPNWFGTRADEFICGRLDTRVYYGEPYLFRAGPAPSGGKFRKSHGTRCDNNGHGKGMPWKRAYVGDQIYQREIREEYGITFTMPDKIPYKYGYNSQRGWKRSKKSKQWM